MKASQLCVNQGDGTTLAVQYPYLNGFKPKRDNTRCNVYFKLTFQESQNMGEYGRA